MRPRWKRMELAVERTCVVKALKDSCTSVVFHIKASLMSIGSVSRRSLLSSTPSGGLPPANR